MKISYRTALFCIALLVTSGVGFGQNPEPTQEKKELIAELSDVIGISRWEVKQELNESNITDLLDPVVSREATLTSPQKQAAEVALAEAKIRLTTRIEEFFTDSSISGAVLADVAAKHIDRTFSAEELRTLIEFYRTPLGKKVSSFNLTLSSDISRGVGEAWTARFKEFSNTVVQEEVELLEKKLSEIKKAGTHIRPPGAEDVPLDPCLDPCDTRGTASPLALLVRTRQKRER